MAQDLGRRLRSLRRRAGVTQARFAEQLGISASYLNLIEHDKRRLPATLAFRAAEVLNVDLRELAVDDAVPLLPELMDVLADPDLEDDDVKAEDVRELVKAQPGVARVLADVYRRWKAAQDEVRRLQAVAAEDMVGVDAGRLPSEEVNDLVSRRRNHFEDAETIAELFWRRYALSTPRLLEGLERILADAFHVEVRVVNARTAADALRRYDPATRALWLSETLPPRSLAFHAAHQLGQLALGHVLDDVARDPGLTTEPSRRLARIVVASYFAGAMLMPYERFWEAAEAERYDLELLGHRFRTGYEQVCHRLTTLRRKGMEGVPFHLVKVDLAGNLAKRFDGSGIRFARFGGGCARWGVHQAFLQPGRIHVQVSEMAEPGERPGAGQRYLTIARTVATRHAGFHGAETIHALELGCRVEHAHRVIYADSVDLDRADVVPIGVNCRVCEREDCVQRAFPNVRRVPLLDAAVRRAAFYGGA
jgi:predicted transcriptional regulator/DNA-binding XRE family transcriptional regulator